MEHDRPHYEVDFERDELDHVAQDLVARFSSFRVWLLEGNLGAGKTTLTKALANQWRVTEAVTSPSFSLVNEYETESGTPVYHLDLYRLKNLEQAIEIGLYEIADSGYVCLIEWASAIGYRPAEPHLVIEINPLSETKRRLSVWKYEN